MGNTLLRTVRVWLKRLASALRRPGAPDGGNARPAPEVALREWASFSLTLWITGQDQPVVMELMPGQPIILGRGDESADIELLVDLTPYNACKLGVSRKHAAIDYRDDLGVVQVMDLSSTNGTYLNGQRLIPYVSRPLREGDEIRLGRLRVEVLYVLGRLRVGVLYAERIPLFVRRIRLYNPSSHALWETNGNTWDAALKLAARHGWMPFLDEYAHQAYVTELDARALAEALARSLPDLADEHKAVAKRLDSPCIEPPARYFSGRAGKLKVCDLIAFCRQGAFRIEVS
jgi:hypothetical protein